MKFRGFNRIKEHLCGLKTIGDVVNSVFQESEILWFPVYSSEMYEKNWKQCCVLRGLSRDENREWRCRSRWTLSAFTRETINDCIIVRPKTCGPSPKVLSAVLNGPLACAFVGSLGGAYDLLKQRVSKIPVPAFSRGRATELEFLVDEYLSALTAGSDDDLLRRLLRRIDAFVLKAYNLPPRLEKHLLDSFRGHKRPVPFDFGDYYPKDFKSYIPLWMYDSEEFQNATAERFLEEIPKITPGELGVEMEKKV